jgi:hypothetical protein
VSTEDIARALVSTGELLWTTALGNKSQIAYRWMSKPNLGDLVLMYLTRPSEPALHRVGTWVGSWTHIAGPDEGANETMPYADRGREEIWMIEQLDGEFLNWGNVQMLRLPRDAAEVRGMSNW